MLFQNGVISTTLLGIFGFSGIFFTMQAAASQLPEIPGNNIIVAIGSFVGALLAAIWRQNNTIKNIDENINKNVVLAKETLEVMQKILKKSEEQLEIEKIHHGPRPITLKGSEWRQEK